MNKSLLKNWWILLVKGIILIILAIFVFRNPGKAILGLSLFIGVGFLLSGIINTVSALSLRKKSKHWGWYLAEGLVDLFFGILFLAKPELTASMMVFMVGLWFLFYAITNLVASFYLKEEGIQNWWLELVWGIFGILFGMLIVFNPFVGLITIVWLLGTFLIIGGVFNISMAFFLKEIKGIDLDIN